MRNKPIFGIALFILFSTFISQNKFTINKFQIKEIKIENNKILGDQELINFFSFLYAKNIIFLNSLELKKEFNRMNSNGISIGRRFSSPLSHGENRLDEECRVLRHNWPLQ